MVDWVLLATGPSMSQGLADSVAHMPRVVVSNAYELAPDADVLVSSDAAWWHVHRAARAFTGRKFSIGYVPDVERLQLPTSSNSGLLAMHVAATLGATRLLLLGYDMAGSHYFGPHPEPLQNTTSDRFETLKRQFAHWAGIQVINCTPGSALDCFPRGRIEDYIC